MWITYYRWFRKRLPSVNRLLLLSVVYTGYYFLYDLKMSLSPLLPTSFPRRSKIEPLDSGLSIGQTCELQELTITSLLIRWRSPLLQSIVDTRGSCVPDGGLSVIC